MFYARHRRCPFGFGTPICRELRDIALTNALVESSLLEDVSSVAGFLKLISFLMPTIILVIIFKNFLLRSRMMI
jgi:hypothetical protein